MLRLYDREGAGRPRRVRWALEEAGAAYEHVVLAPEEVASEDHRRRQPLGRVPVLETPDGTIFESAAICFHVADLFPEAGLIGQLGSLARARAYQWGFFGMDELEPALIAAIRAHRAEDDAAAAAARPRLEEALAVLDRHLEGRDYLLDSFTIADVIVGGVATPARTYEVMGAESPMASYLQRLDARPARQRSFS